MKKSALYFEKRKAYGIIFLRLVAGWRLIAGQWDYVIQSKPMSEVQGFFEGIHIPVPMISAYVSVYAQFICGILFILGLWVRSAAILMIINFSVAIIAANLDKGIEKSFAAWILFATAILLLFTGSGKISIDERINHYRSSYQ